MEDPSSDGVLGLAVAFVSALGSVSVLTGALASPSLGFLRRRVRLRFFLTGLAESIAPAGPSLASISALKSASTEGIVVVF